MVEKLGKKHLQDQMLADGLLSNLKLWLELLPNGSLPNVQIRTALLRCLQSLHIDLSSETRRDQVRARESSRGREIRSPAVCPCLQRWRPCWVSAQRCIQETGLGERGCNGGVRAAPTCRQSSRIWQP